MKKLSIEEKAKRYDEILEGAKYYYESMASNTTDCVLEELIPELIESNDEQIRKYLIDVVNDYCKGHEHDGCIAWLKKQGDTNKTINRDEFAQGVLRGAAINLITWIDYNTAKGNTCLSNMECKVIEDALVNGDWDKIYAYIKRKLEKQGEQKSTWSEEDEEMLEDIRFNYEFNKSRMTEGLIKQYNKWFEKIKSLKPQSHWKPSEEQLNALDKVYKTHSIDGSRRRIIFNLFEQLKKL